MSTSSDRSDPRTGERIAKLLARAGVASRREAERMIAEGRVKLGEQVIATPNTVLPGLKGVTVDGKPVQAPEAARLFAFHKPSGLLTAERDPAGRPTIYTALRNALPPGTPRLMPVGRLDLNTEGLLLLTNDGGLKRTLELPATGVPRTYRARTFGDISQTQLEDLIEGIEVEGVRYGKIDANLERRTGKNQWVEMTLTEGKNREVRRVLEHLGLQVSRLLRTSYGPFALGDLPRGAAVEIRQVDVERFVKSLKSSGLQDFGPPRPVAVGPAQPKPREMVEPRQQAKGDSARPKARTDARHGAKSDAKAGAKPDVKSGAKRDAKFGAKHEARPDAKPGARSGSRPETRPEARRGAPARPGRPASPPKGRGRRP